MQSKPYDPQLIAALREALQRLENLRLGSPDDPALAELKDAIARRLAEQERLADAA